MLEAMLGGRISDIMLSKNSPTSMMGDLEDSEPRRRKLGVQESAGRKSEGNQVVTQSGMRKRTLCAASIKD